MRRHIPSPQRRSWSVATRPRLRPSRLRGAALVEAAVVIPVLVALLGVGMMLARAYSEKLEANQAIRASALDYASHDCERAGLRGGANTTPGATRDLAALPGRERPTPGAAGAVARQLEKTTPALSGRAGHASARYAERVIDNPHPSSATGGFGWKLTLHGERAETLCNDPPREGSIAGLAEYVRDEVAK